MKNGEFLSPWYEALHSEIGLVLQVTERRAFAQKLYQARAKEGNPELEGLTVIVPKDSDELWIVKKENLK